MSSRSGDTLEQLREIGRRVLEDCGFGAMLPHGRGVSVLFGGSLGTGKTMAAEVIARELDLDLYRIHLSQVVSKCIGETEKRSQVRDAHDRYANIEIAYLLQRVERYDGLAILATNLRQSLDEAFLRRHRRRTPQLPGATYLTVSEYVPAA